MAKLTTKEVNAAPKQVAHDIRSFHTGHKVIQVDGQFRLVDSTGLVVARANTLDEVERDYRKL